jgi:hypothetical protein
MPPSVITDVAQYGKIRDQIWSEPSLLKHFPAFIPSSAHNVKLSFYPGFLQAGGWLQIEMTLPAEDIQTLEQQIPKQITDPNIPLLYTDSVRVIRIIGPQNSIGQKTTRFIFSTLLRT